MLENYWTLEPEEVARELSSSLQGLSASDAEARLKMSGRNEIRDGDELSRWKVLWSQLRSPLFASMPGKTLLLLTVALIVVTLLIPYLSFSSVFGFVPVRPGMMAVLVGIVIAYMFSAELLKRWFYRS